MWGAIWLHARLADVAFVEPAQERADLARQGLVDHGRVGGLEVLADPLEQGVVGRTLTPLPIFWAEIEIPVKNPHRLTWGKTQISLVRNLNERRCLTSPGNNETCDPKFQRDRDKWNRRSRRF